MRSKVRISTTKPAQSGQVCAVSDTEGGTAAGGKLNMKNMNTRTLTRVALLVALELVMKAVGLGSVHVGPL